MRRIPLTACAFLYLFLSSALASQTSVGWPEVVGILAYERSKAEACVGAIKAGDDRAAMERARQTYGMAKAEMDGAIAGLMAALAEGGDPNSLPHIRTSLDAAGKDLREICDAAGTEPATEGAAEQATSSVLTNSIANSIASLWARSVEKDALAVETKRARLEAARWPPFDNVAVLHDDASESHTDLYDRPVLAVDPGMHTGKISAQAVDAAGRFAVTGGDDRTVRIWFVADSKLLRTIWIPFGPGRVGAIYAVAMSPDGSMIAVGGSTETLKGDTAIYIFERESGTLVRRIRGDLPNVVLSLKFSPEGRFLAATLLGGKGLRVFDRDNDWSEAFRDEQYGDDSYGVAFSQDGRLATTALDGMIRLYKYVSSKGGGADFRRIGEPIRAVSDSLPYGIAYSPNNKRLAVGYAGVVAVDVFDALTMRRVGSQRPADVLSPAGSPNPAGSEVVAWSRDGQTLFAAGDARDNKGRALLFAWDRGGQGHERRMSYCAPAMASGVDALPDGRILVSTAQPCVGLIDASGEPIWTVEPPPILDFRGQSNVMRVSGDGKVVDIGVQGWEAPSFRFDMRSLTLSGPPPNDGLTFAPKHEGLPIASWLGARPTLSGRPLPLEPYDVSESLAVAPDATRFFLGSDIALAAFDEAGMQKWRWPNRHEVWAVNASKDGRIVVTADGGGTIRWRRAADGAELLALQIIRTKKESAPSEWDWVLSTPEGFYQATPGVLDPNNIMLKWVINHGPDNAPTTAPITAISSLRRPDVLPRVLDELDVARALGVADLSEARLDVQKATGAARPPGGVLHVLAIGIDQYGDRAGGLTLDYAAKDAHDVAAALLESQKGEPGKASLYADVKVTYLQNEDADRASILEALDDMAVSMARNGSGQDLAIIFYSGHSAIFDGRFSVIPYGFDSGSRARSLASSLSGDEFARNVRAIAENGKVLLLLDAAHSGAILQDARDLEQNVSILTSSGKNEPSYELSEWKHGAFTEAFLDALKGAAYPKGVIRLSALTDAMEIELQDLTKGQQHLGIRVNFGGDLLVAGHY